jgi:hypothetical protein
MKPSKLSVAMLAAGSALVLTLVPAAAQAHHGRHHGHNLIRADLTPSMPTDAPINGVNPGGLPWVLDRGQVRWRDNGRVDVRIEGLQIPFATGDANPIASIDAVLYCDGMMAADSGPQPMTVPGGDARFRAMVATPSRCHDATVLISPSTAVNVAYIASAMAD